MPQLPLTPANTPNIMSSLTPLHTLSALTILENMKGGAIEEEKKEDEEKKEEEQKKEEVPKKQEEELRVGEGEKEKEGRNKGKEVQEATKNEYQALIAPQEKVAITTLVSLPHSTPTISLAKLRKATFLTTLSTKSHEVSKDNEEDIDLNEEIIIPKFDLDNLSLEKIEIMQLALHRKTRQE